MKVMVQLQPCQLADLDAAARETGIGSRSALIRLALTEYIQRQKRDGMVRPTVAERMNAGCTPADLARTERSE